MKAFYIVWIYDSSANDANYYAGNHDEKLFYHKENAEKYAKDRIKQWKDDENKFDKLNEKDENEGLSPEEQYEWVKLARICCGDIPIDYNICEREINFEDEL